MNKQEEGRQKTRLMEYYYSPHSETIVIPPTGEFWHIVSAQSGGQIFTLCGRSINENEVAPGDLQTAHEPVTVRRLCTFCRGKLARGE